MAHELLHLVESNPEGIKAIDPVKELKLNDLDFVTAYKAKKQLESNLGYSICFIFAKCKRKRRRRSRRRRRRRKR